MHSSDNSNFICRLLFKVKLYEASGYAFQQLFNSLMQYSLPGFQPVAPWGNWGDGGNDGWCASENRYYQVFGPQATTDISPVEVVKKAVADFSKLKAKWLTIERYHFVYNDRYKGVPAPIGSMLQSLAFDENLMEASPVSAGDLEERFMRLENAQKMMIVGGIPSEYPDFIDPSAVGELLAHLASMSHCLTGIDLKTPDFSEKIELNGITAPITDYLRFFSYQVDEVNRFLRARDTGLSQRIAMEIRELYFKSKSIIPDSYEAPNERYVWLMEQLIPDKVREHPHSLVAYRDAAQVIIAKYFETCDVYEHPNSIDPS